MEYTQLDGGAYASTFAPAALGKYVAYRHPLDPSRGRLPPSGPPLRPQTPCPQTAATLCRARMLAACKVLTTWVPARGLCRSPTHAHDLTLHAALHLQKEGASNAWSEFFTCRWMLWFLLRIAPTSGLAFSALTG